MPERLIDNPVQVISPFNDKELPINSYNFVDTILDVTKKHLTLTPSALKVGNIVLDIYSAYITIKEQEILTKRIQVTPITESKKTDAFNELMRAFNIAWSEVEGTPVRITPGMFVFSWLPDKSGTVFESQYYPDYASYLTNHREIVQGYFDKTTGYTSIRSIFHEIQDGQEYVGVGKSMKRKEANSYQTNIVGIMEMGKGMNAGYSILHKSCDFVGR